MGEVVLSAEEVAALLRAHGLPADSSSCGDVLGDTAALLRAGATMVRFQDADIEWDVLADPEGNEFCVFAPE